MIEFYASFEKENPQNYEAARILKESVIPLGVETSNIEFAEDVAGKEELMISLHTPHPEMTLNLAAPDYYLAFHGERGARLLEAIRKSDAPTVGLHCGYSAEAVYKMIAFPNVPKKGTCLSDWKLLLERISGNLVMFERKVNAGMPDKSCKKIVIESLDYSRDTPIPWERQLPEAEDNHEAIDDIVSKHGTNASLLHVTSPQFIQQALDCSAMRCINPPGFLFDISHNYISADAKIHKNEFHGTVEDYFYAMLKASRGKTYQIHLSVPEGDRETGYADAHRPFAPGTMLSDQLIELAKGAVKMSPELCVVTLEMRTGLGPIEHAREMVRQAEYVSRALF